MGLPKHAIIVKMNDSRLTKKIYSWDIAFSEQHNVQTWASEIRDILLSHNLANYFDPGMNCKTKRKHVFKTKCRIAE